MKVVMVFLEKYVQWVALGLGACWMLFMGWMYWSGPVAKVSLDGPGGDAKVYKPGELDAMLADPKERSPVTTLVEALNNTSTEKPKKKDLVQAPATTQSFVREYVATLQGQKGELIPAIIPGNRGGVPVMAVGPEVIQSNVRGDLAQKELDKLPILTLAVGKDSDGNPGSVSSDRSVTQIPDKSTLVDPMAEVAVPGAGGVVPPVAPPVVNVVAPVPTEREMGWATVSGIVDMQLLGQALTAANTPPPAFFTLFLRVELVREEQVNGQWVNATTISSLANRIVPPLPKAGDKDKEADYLAWASKSVQDIVHPPFYVVSGGAKWRTVNMPKEEPDPNANGAIPVVDAQAFDPANPPSRPLTIEEQGKVYQYNLQKKREEAKRKALENRPKTPAGEGRPSPIPPLEEPILLAQVRPGIEGRPMEGRPPVRPGYTPPVTPTPAQPGGVSFAPPGAGAELVAIPDGPFDPRALTKVEVFAHDETIEPGKTYRYKLVVYIKNPLYATQNMAKNPSDADVFTLKMESPVTAAFTVPSKYFFFLAANPTVPQNNGNIVLGKYSAKLDYWYWNKGVWTKKGITVQPGDAVGDTEWTLVDLRRDGRGGNGDRDRAIFVNARGETAVHTMVLDKADKDNQRLSGPKPAAGTPGGGSLGVSAGAPTEGGLR